MSPQNGFVHMIIRDRLDLECMRRSVAVLGVALMLAAVMLPLADTSESASASTAIEGYLWNETKNLGNASHIDITVYSWSGNNTDNAENIGSVSKLTPVTDKNGVFKFSVSVNPVPNKQTTYLSIDIDGFSVASISGALIPEAYNIPVQIGDIPITVAAYRFSGEGPVDSPTYSLNTNATPISMKSAQGTVTGKVVTNTKDPIPLNNVKVTLYDLETEADLTSTYTTNGTYTIKYSTGTYGLKYHLENYIDRESVVTLSDGQTYVMSDIILNEANSWFGMDLPHVMMILGGIIAVVLILLISAYRIKLMMK